MTDKKQDLRAEIMVLVDVYARALTDRIAELEAENLKLEILCDATYVDRGADAYHHACEQMERYQEKRRKAGKEVGTTHSLCDGMDWVYGRLDELEAQLEAVGAGGVSRLMPRPVFGAAGSRDVDVAAKQKAWDAAPQPQQIAEPAAVERKPLNAAERRSPPLTTEQIDEIHLTNSDAYERGDVYYESHGFARAIEAAHGITEQQGGRLWL